MRTFGKILLFVGILLLIIALTMDVSVEVNYSGGNELGFPKRVNNLGLMSERQNYTIIAVGLIIASTILIVSNPKKDISPFPLQSKTTTKDIVDRLLIFLDRTFRIF
ncbi:MAG: hypothetical protein A2X17_01395 [Bacteroidetes bacterium GWF2_41_61]|nr:MAG: hypothetical protein A2X17_01395 [Bacteroidetes bacterium GWF2_41_61]OFY91788.1 MAG: hypothetical protein A2266_07370 [Bacteroidetes bacterium RIFOXYA12_FULL_40_10]